MIRDASNNFADGLAWNGVSTTVNLGKPRKGPGGPIKCFIEGHSLVACTGFTILDGPVDPPATTRGTVNVTLADLNAGPIEFHLPSNIQQYVRIALIGATTSGTWDCGVVDGVQTSK